MDVTRQVNALTNPSISPYAYRVLQRISEQQTVAVSSLGMDMLHVPVLEDIGAVRRDKASLVITSYGKQQVSSLVEAGPDYFNAGHSSSSERLLYFVDASGDIHKKTFVPGQADGDHAKEFADYTGRVLAQGRIDLTNKRATFQVATSSIEGVKLCVDALQALMFNYRQCRWYVYDGPVYSADEWLKYQEQEIHV